jgi:hypothetical protein
MNADIRIKAGLPIVGGWANEKIRPLQPEMLERSGCGKKCLSKMIWIFDRV